MSEAELTAAATRLAGTNGIAEQRLMNEPDTYFIGQGGRLPVYRIVLNDAESTRYYLDPTTGALLARLDTNRRWHRWLFGAIHRLDFAAWVRVRPAWDIILMALMLGGFAVKRDRRLPRGEPRAERRHHPRRDQRQGHRASERGGDPRATIVTGPPRRNTVQITLFQGAAFTHSGA